MTAEYEVENGDDDLRPAERRIGLFSERRIAVKTSYGHRIIALSRTSQVGLAMVGIALAGWFAYSTYGLIRADIAIESSGQSIATKSGQVVGSDGDHDKLVAQVQTYQQRLAEVSMELSDSQKRLAGLMGQNSQLKVDMLASTDQLEMLKQAAAAATAELAAKDTAVDGLLDETLILKSDLSSARQQLDGLEQEQVKLRSVEQQVLTVTSKLSQQGSVLDELVEQNLSLKSDLSMTRDQLRKATSETERLKVVESDLVAARDKLGKATADAEKLRVVEADLAAVRGQLHEAAKESEQLRAAGTIAASKTAQLTKTEQAVDALLDQNLLLKADLASTRKKLREVDEARAVEIARAEKLGAEVDTLGSQIKQLTARGLAMEKGTKVRPSKKSDVAVNAQELPNSSAGNEQLRAMVAKLEQRIATLQRSQQDFLLHVTERTINTIDEAERTISLTGLGVEWLLDRAGDIPVAMGGPFIDVNADLMAASELRQEVTVLDSHMSRWERLQYILRMLPLSAPVDAYRATSTFGKRKDPLNGRWAMHYGMDMAAPSGSPILVPSAGTVVFAGWNAGFGRTVEIDHGMGIRTRYGHLRSIAVKKGEKVGFREAIGLLGSSGRSTGPHVHYEILIDGNAVDPVKFLTAGKYVFKG